MTAVPPPEQPQLLPAAPGGLTSRGLIGIIAGGGGAIVLIAASIMAGMLPPVLQAPPIVNAANEQNDDESYDGVVGLYSELNLALRDRDRERFLSHVSGDAVAPLTLWWDNMEKIGWTTAAIDFQSGFVEPPAAGQSVEVGTIFGAAMGFSAFSPRGNGTDDAGLSFIQGFPYRATVTAGDALTISGWEPLYTPSPWDSGELHVAKSEHALVAGPVAESALIDASLPAAEAAAVWVLDDFAAAGREIPLDGFTAFVTADDALFQSWFSSEPTTEWRIDPAGFASPSFRPMGYAPSIDPLIATGSSTSTGVVSMGPGSIGDGMQRIFTHEFVHVVHYTEVPGGFAQPPRATIEGWARYQDRRSINGGTYPKPDSELSYCVDTALDPTGAAPTDAQLLSGDPGCAYMLASSRYAYAADNGYDVYQLASLAKNLGSDPITVSTELGQDPLLSDAGWVAWVTANY